MFQSAIIAKWSDWEDSPAGIDSYHFEVYHLQPADGVLVHGDKVLNAVEAKLSPDISEVISLLKETKSATMNIVRKYLFSF